MLNIKTQMMMSSRTARFVGHNWINRWAAYNIEVVCSFFHFGEEGFYQQMYYNDEQGFWEYKFNN